MDYCCEAMKEADQDAVIDYCEPNLTTIDTQGGAYPISYCPFCGKKLVGSIKSMKEISKTVKDIKEGKAKWKSHEEVFGKEVKK